MAGTSRLDALEPAEWCLFGSQTAFAGLLDNLPSQQD